MKCKKCSAKQTSWTNQQKQYYRLINRGYSKEQAKDILPLCQKCVTRLLNKTDDK